MKYTLICWTPFIKKTFSRSALKKKPSMNTNNMGYKEALSRAKQ